MEPEYEPKEGSGLLHDLKASAEGREPAVEIEPAASSEHDRLSFLQEKRKEVLEGRADAETLAAYVRCAEELASALNPVGLAVVAHQSLEGSPAFAKDPGRALRCFEQLFALTQDPLHAGLIASLYLNRTLYPEPPYDQIYEYASFGTIGGDETSSCILSDLFLKGLGTRKNVSMAMRLLLQLYRRTRSEVQAGRFDNLFPECACRIAGIFERGEGKEAAPGQDDLTESYGYYLQARHILRLRSRFTKRTSEEGLAERIEEGIERTRKHVEERQGDRFVMPVPLPLFGLLQARGAVGMRFERTYAGEIQITGLLVTPTLRRDIRLFLLSIPQFSCAALVNKVVLHTFGLIDAKVPDGSKAILIDAMIPRNHDGVSQICFCFGGKTVAWIEARNYVLEVPGDVTKEMEEAGIGEGEEE